MAGASMIHGAYEMGRANEQINMAQKHSHALIGRPGWDGSSDFANDPDAVQAAHDALMGHLDAAQSAAKHAGSVIDASLRARDAQLDNGPEKEPGATNKAIKGHLDREGDQLRFFIPFTKVTSLKTTNGETLMIEGCASVADLLDDQGDIADEEALRAAMDAWAPYGNVRLQHKADRPVGTIRNPVIGELPDGVGRPGWWMAEHPRSRTQAAFVRAHIVEPETIKLIKTGVMTGFSIGGTVTDSRDIFVDVDDLGVVQQVLGEAA
jgi:hypothetical protein